MNSMAVTAVEAAGVRPEPNRSPAAAIAPTVSGQGSPAGGIALPRQMTVPESHPVTVPVQDVHKSATQIDDFLKRTGHQLSIAVDSSSGQVVVQVRDPVSGDLIRQIPSDEALRIARNLDQEGAALIDELT